MVVLIWKNMLFYSNYAKTYATILDKNVQKNARYMFNFRILPSKARFTQDTPPSPPKKTMLKCGPNIFAAY